MIEGLPENLRTFENDKYGKLRVRLRRHQGMTVPKNVLHRPRSPERSVVLMVESVGIVPTGD